jgi:O-acetyl-ADP-ribose deacetylase (regulator of RNase III)
MSMRSSTRRTSGCSAAAASTARFIGPQGRGYIDACLAVPEVRPGVRCPTGHSRITPGFNLRARYVIHTVGPVWRGGRHDEAPLLASCYRSALELARHHHVRSIAFPAISCGVYGYPIDQASAIAVRETARHRERLRSHRPRRIRRRCSRGLIGRSERERIERFARSERRERPERLNDPNDPNDSNDPTIRTTVYMQTILTDRLGLQHPIIQAPLAGGGDTPELVAAVCEAGALGSIGATYLTPQQIVDASAAVRAKTRRPFGINLFVPERACPTTSQWARPSLGLRRFTRSSGCRVLNRRHAPGAISTRSSMPHWKGARRCFSFTFGMLPASARDKVKARGVTLAGTATTVDEAVALERAGVDLVVAQGSEAGGHRGTFADAFDATAFEQGMVGTLALVPQMVDAVGIPVIASAASWMAAASQRCWRLAQSAPSLAPRS